MKLVRDRIPQIIESEGRTCEYRKVHDHDEHMRQLRAKMSEETNEFFENPCVEEAADMLEVLYAFIFLHNINFDDVMNTAYAKEDARGGFMGGIILKRADPPAKKIKDLQPGMEWDNRHPVNDPADW